MILRSLAVLGLALVLAAPLSAQERPQRPGQGGEQRSGGPGVLSLLPSDAVSDHEIEAGGERLAYTATAGTLNLFDQSGERSAAIFYTAYVLKGQAAETRPVTFVVNGGPGAASAYLHLGLAGPRVIEFGADGRDGAHARLRDNPDTWLKFTDLVMVDPIGTGWSRAAKPDDAKNFYGVREDAQVLAKTIALYLARNGRTQAPKYLLGESYGGFRSLKVARALQQDQGLVIAGIVMVSPLIDGGLQFGSDRLALGAALQLPSLAAADLELRHAFSADTLSAAERFAMTDYLTTLAGPAPQGEAAKTFYARVAELTGLPLEVVTRARGFLGDVYAKHLRGREQQIVSPYDVTFTAPDAFPTSDHGNDDPILDGYTRALGGTFVGYARGELGFKTDMTYILLARDIAGHWDWGGGGRSPATAEPDLRELLALDPSFHVLIAHGYSDMVIPYYVSRYIIDHLPPLGGADRAQLKLYRGGHMMYFNPASRAALTADARSFYAAPTQ
ncbi:MAG: carboxypeptidase [Xanthobacteraceae bacterium]